LVSQIEVYKSTASPNLILSSAGIKSYTDDWMITPLDHQVLRENLRTTDLYEVVTICLMLVSYQEI